MAKRPRMQAKRLVYTWPCLSHPSDKTAERRIGDRGRSWKREDSEPMSAFWKQIDREQCLKHPVISEFNAKDFGSSRAVPIFLL